jgi:hypothetical protein
MLNANDVLTHHFSYSSFDHSDVPREREHGSQEWNVKRATTWTLLSVSIFIV